MATHIRPGGNSAACFPARVDRKAFSSAATQNLNLHDRFELDRPCFSQGDNHPKVSNHLSRPLRVASGSHSKQQNGKASAADNDELVKHMSNLPSYLEQGVKCQEKAFNVGVIDWTLLEKWQSSKQVPCRRDGSSSSNNNSSVSSMGESSTHNRTGHSSSVAHHRHQHHVYQFKMKETLEGKSSHSFSENQRGLREESGYRDASVFTTACSKNDNLDRPDGSSRFMGQHHADSEKERRRYRRSESMSLNPKSVDNSVHSQRPDDCSVEFISKGLKLGARQKPTEENERSSNVTSTKVYSSENNSDIPCSFQLPCDLNDKNIRVDRPCGLREAKTSACSGHVIVPLKVACSDNNCTASVAAIPTVTELCEVSRILRCTEDVAKARYSSPTGRFRFGIGTASEKPSSTQDPERMQDCSAHTVAKSCAVRDLKSSIERSCSDKSAAAIKARSSSLKRLVDPLLKARERNNGHSSLPLDRVSKPVGRISKTLGRPSTALGVRAGLSLSSEKTSSIHKPHYNEKDKGTEVVQAILQVGFQNGCPMFIFAVDSAKDILCAAMSKLSTKKECEERYLYTLFSIHEPKNKSWTNLRGKGKGQKYSPNVVAQIEVLETELINAMDNHSTRKDILREFVSTTVILKPGGKTDSYYQLNDELAAVVVAIPREAKGKNRTTVILPSGIHTLPRNGKPASLIERWRSVGQCDCGGWDSGCKLRILTGSKFPSSSLKYKLFDQLQGEDAEATEPVFNVAPLKDKEGVLSVSYSSSISPLQAFSICLAVLDTRKHSERSLEEAKTSIRNLMMGPGRQASVLPDSPVGRV